MSNIKWGVFAAIGALVISFLIGLISGFGFIHVFLRALLFSAIFFGIGYGLRFVINNFFPDLLIKDGSSDTFVQTSNQSGSQINITIDNTGEFAVPELYKAPNDPQEMGNIEDLISGVFYNHAGSRNRQSPPRASVKGVDAKARTGYNEEVQEISTLIPEDIPFLDNDVPESSGFESTLEEKQEDKPVFTPSFGDDDDGLGGLPDLDMMARAFSSGFTSAPHASVQSSSASPVQTPAAPVFMPTEIPTIAEEFEQQTNYNKGNRPVPMKGDFNPQELAKGLRSVLEKEK